MTSNALEILLRAHDNGRLPHGILLHGPELSVLEETACAVAARLLACAPDDVTRHPDFSFARPANKTRQIPIEAMRELVRRISQTPSAGGRKVVFVHEADRLAKISADTFLKTLEEPPGDTTIFLFSTRPAQLGETIRSRCHHFCVLPDRPPPSDPAWDEWLDALDDWVCDVAAPVRTDKVRAAGLLFTLYGLVERFAGSLEAASAAAWDRARKDLPAGIDADEAGAIEAGIGKGVRTRRLADISARLCALYARSPGPAATRALGISIQKLERAAGLLEANLQVVPALEYALLHWLRAWSAR
ncbi:MAG: hypothetical protein LBG65_03640 [Puniceicoccales bacterium]|jgi:DNA polymerase-3 subunit delta'|nr:hypothetical protein [Puniceicoccales bacterium]